MRKYNIFIFILFIIFITSIDRVYAIINSYSLFGKIIYLDAGHGGVDSGAIYQDIYEKDINLVLVKLMKDELIKRGAVVYLTRDNDYDLSTTKTNRKRSDLENRAKLINNSLCDMYISIHLNYFNSSKWSGMQIFYNDKNKLNEDIARSITNYLKEKDINIRDYKKSNDYYMYKLINKPGILIEMGFLSNPNDRYILTKNKYQIVLVKNIVDAIERYYN